MNYELQRASMWKRIAAGMFDAILTGILAVGLAFLLSVILNYDDSTAALEKAYTAVEAEYGVTLDITQAEYAALSHEDRENYDAAYQALTTSEDVQRAYSVTVNLMLVVTTFSILLAILGMEFAVPLLFGNGQTLGKKIFGLCLMRTDGVAMNRMQLFARTILGKFTIETMVPVCILFMIFWGILDITGTMLVLCLGVAQLAILALSRNRSLIHDLVAGTAVVDYASQMIFRTTEDLIAYQKKAAAERSARQTY